MEIYIIILHIIIIALILYAYRMQKYIKDIRSTLHSVSAEKEQASTKIEKIKEKENELADILDIKRNELISFALNIVHKNEFLENLKNKVNELKNTAQDEQTLKKLNQLSTDINQHIAIDKNRMTFQLQLEESNRDFYVRLQEKYPTLTEKEKRLAAYLRLQLNSKEIASLLNISSKSVEMNRYRLRKKLKISSSENLVKFILDI